VAFYRHVRNTVLILISLVRRLVQAPYVYFTAVPTAVTVNINVG